MTRPTTQQLDADRAMLVDFIHHDAAACDDAARRLANSHRADDRLMGREWLKIRATECARPAEDVAAEHELAGINPAA